MLLVAGQHGRHGNQRWTQRSLLQRVPISGSKRPFAPLQTCHIPKHSGGRRPTCLRPMACRSSPTTSLPSQSDALKPFVQVRRMPWRGTKVGWEAGCPLESHLVSQSPHPLKHRMPAVPKQGPRPTRPYRSPCHSSDAFQCEETCQRPPDPSSVLVPECSGQGCFKTLPRRNGPLSLG